MNEQERLWRTMVKTKYGMVGLNWVPTKLYGTSGVGLWTFITKVGKDSTLKLL